MKECKKEESPRKPRAQRKSRKEILRASVDRAATGSRCAAQNSMAIPRNRLERHNEKHCASGGSVEIDKVVEEEEEEEEDDDDWERKVKSCGEMPIAAAA